MQGESSVSLRSDKGHSRKRGDDATLIWTASDWDGYRESIEANNLVGSGIKVRPSHISIVSPLAAFRTPILVSHTDVNEISYPSSILPILLLLPRPHSPNDLAMLTSSPASSSGKSTDLTDPSSSPVPGEQQIPYEDVAIIGMSCRAAGDNTDPEKLWQFLLAQKDASGEVPAWRWEPWLRRDARNKAEVEQTLTKGYFIEDLENFDAAFFGVSPKEAEQMDPHQRLGLELSWEALENAGIDPKSLAGSDTAVFMGIDSDDYSRLLMEDLPNIEAWMGIGTAAHGVPNRISYHLDLMGPSAAIDAACASSLITVHMGRQAILNRESKVAIVGGVNVLLAPALTRMLGKAGALSPEGICRSFDDDANGYARGEGGAVLVLKRLSSAIADGDNILATLKGSAVAQDGKTNGIMAPNAKAQELVARQTLTRSGIDPLTVGYVEAHATSTPLGDPTEISAIAAVYGEGAGRTADNPVFIGSIKPNVGHLEAAAGAIGLIKSVLAVNKGQLAPQAKLNKLNSRVDWKKSGLHVVRETAEWTNPDGPRRAAVCSYGYGGTVSHAVVEEFTGNNLYGDSMPARLETDPVLLTISAAQEKRLVKQATSLAEWLSSPAGKGESLGAIANTLAQRRAHYDYRAAFVVTSHEEAIAALTKFAKGDQDETIAQGRVLGSADGLSRNAVWVFSGHGAQWNDMGKELLHDPVFRQALATLEPIYEKEAGFSVVQALETGDFEASERVQIMTYAIQIGLSQVLQSKGVGPRAVIGHSVGEIAASVVAGCLTPEEGALVVIRRAKLYARVREQGLGGMALVNRPFAEVATELGARKDLVAAIDSSPSTCVVSGDAAAVDKYVETLKSRSIKTFRVKTDVAFHSPVLDQLAGPLEEALAGALHPRPGNIPVYSTSHSDQRTDAPRDVAYWVHNMISPVQLNAAVNTAVDDGYRVFVEVSSHPIVLHSVNEILVTRNLDESEFATISTMKRDASATKTIHSAIAQLYIRGANVDFATQLGHKRWWSKTVPGTPWAHKPYWKQVETGPLGEGQMHDVKKHTLLGQRIAVAGTDTVLYTTKLDEKTKPFPGTHPLDGTEIIPAAVYINTFHYASGGSVISDIQLRVPVSMGPETRNVQIIVQGEEIKVASSSTSALDDKDQTWVSHSSARWSPLDKTVDKAQTFDVEAIKARIGTKLPNSFSVDYLTKIGVAGIAFPWQVVEHYGNTKEMIAKVDMDPSVEKYDWDARSWGPLLDAATSVGSTIFFNDPKLRIVSQIDRVSLLSTDALPKIGYLYVEEAADAKSPGAHVSVLNEKGEMLAKFTSMRFAEVEGASGVSGSVDSLVHQLSWIPPRFAEKPRQLNQVVLVSTDAAILESYGNQLQSQTQKLFKVSSVKELEEQTEILSVLGQKGSAIIYAPGSVESLQEVSAAAKDYIWEATSIVKLIATKSLTATCKLFIITNRVYTGESTTGLAHGPLYGLARIIASEHPDLWGALIDNETTSIFPVIAAKYVHEQDIVRVVDGLPRCAIMRPLSREQRYKPDSLRTLMPKPEGTYIITGGLGPLGLETCSFLIEKGARRIVVVSRRSLPPRNKWSSLATTDPALAAVVERIQSFEKLGATIHSLALDISAPNASETLLSALDNLSLPPVLGVVHAAGVLEDDLILNTTKSSFSNVLAPKVDGALALHTAFPPSSGLDFFVLYSSIGQLVGTAGQASYGSGNAFLDALALHRRARGDNTVAFQFTAWRGLGMATSTDFLTLELRSKGITDISAEEAFRAWEHLGKFDIEGAVVTRCLPIDEGEAVACPLLEDVVVRRARAGNASAPDSSSAAESGADARPTAPDELAKWLNIKIRECIAAVLMMTDIDDIDARAPVADLGVDSVMTVALRQKLQSALKVKVPPTLTWNHPTVNHLVAWFVAKFAEESS
ncbi:6-methylsalicylic acid synthase [Pseudomassariella vexata]|uniref:6-methylsalicylic acid synthase n=1 Tax=Pseudomassariella vexata TaxID=1141098 RepID=A0A1Y2DHW0_9PEZI|nr:6-methylsalicylic acid synthase [Pseudomassariella vexata]ORY58820.1 6-methylsalicylic acid synthase [Pseudomassariella vexata]